MRSRLLAGSIAEMTLVPWLWQISYSLCYIVLLLRGRLRVRVHSAVPKGPILLCAKHVSSLDIPLFAYVCRKFRGDRPYFQMGSFIGYRVLGPLSPILRRIGAFPVMRPKETRRLMDLKGMDRREALECMRQFNDEAERTRQRVLKQGGCLIVFPEGTRNESEVLPIKSKLEIASALTVLEEGHDVPIQIWPAVASFGPRRFFRRRIIVELLPPFAVEGSVDDMTQKLEAIFQEWWRPAEIVEAVMSSPGGDKVKT
ncbi:MAG TPA: 1-acyl-sn-glycerol-3-phosphate acyltransferase [Planctomycetota bacterium]|nr:1-acyl-sn-glycerol-3-phosphate acyltransferase [Planctomycetota bacterium]